jgi:hypothetical protein
MPTLAFADTATVKDEAKYVITVAGSSQTVEKTDFDEAVAAVNDGGTITASGTINLPHTINVSGKTFTINYEDVTFGESGEIKPVQGACWVGSGKTFKYDRYHQYESAVAKATAADPRVADVVVSCKNGDSVETTATDNTPTDRGTYYEYSATVGDANTGRVTATWTVDKVDAYQLYQPSFVKDGNDVAVLDESGKVSFYSYYQIRKAGESTWTTVLDDQGKEVKLQGTIKSETPGHAADATHYGTASFVVTFTFPDGTTTDQPYNDIRVANMTEAKMNSIRTIAFLYKDDKGNDVWNTVANVGTATSVTVTNAMLPQEDGSGNKLAFGADGSLTYRLVYGTDKGTEVTGDALTCAVDKSSANYKEYACGAKNYVYSKFTQKYTNASGAIVTVTFTVNEIFVNGTHKYADRDTWASSFPAVTIQDHTPQTVTAHCSFCDKDVRVTVPGTDHQFVTNADGTDKVVTVKANCLHAGYQYKICKLNDGNWSAGTYELKDANGKVVDTLYATTHGKYTVFEGTAVSQHPVLVEGTVTKKADHDYFVTNSVDPAWAVNSSYDKKVDVTCNLTKECDNCSATQAFTYHRLTFAEAMKAGVVSTTDKLDEGSTDTMTKNGVVHVFGAIDVNEQAGADCTKASTFTFTVKNVSTVSGKAISTEVKSTVFSGPHTYKNTVAFSEDGKTASVLQQCSKTTGCLGYKDTDGNGKANKIDAKVTAADNADGSTTYTATVEGLELTDNTKTVFDLTKAVVTVNEGKELDLNTATVADIEDPTKGYVAVTINGVAINAKYYTISVANNRLAVGNNIVTVTANTAYNAYGEAKGVVNCVKPGVLNIATTSFDGKLTDDVGYKNPITYDGNAHAVVITAKDGEGKAAPDATIKYAVAKKSLTTAEIKELVYDLDKVELTEAATYYVYAQLSKEGYTTQNVTVGSFEIKKIDTKGAKITTKIQYMVYGDTGLVATTGDADLDKAIELTTVDASKLGVGSYNLEDLISYNHNYDVTVTGSVVIEKRNATIVMLNDSKVYDGKKADVDGLFTIDGAVNGDDLNVVVNVKGGKAPKNAGEYTLVATANDANYNIETVTATYTVNKAAQKVKKIKPAKKTVAAGKSFKLKATATGDKNAKVTFKKTSGSKKISVSKAGKVTVKKGTKKGTYKIKVKATKAATKNYKAASKSRTITVTVK